MKMIGPFTVEFTCGCEQTLRFVCDATPGGVCVDMGCCTKFTVPGEVVQILGLSDGKWITLQESRGWIESGQHSRFLQTQLK